MFKRKAKQSKVRKITASMPPLIIIIIIVVVVVVFFIDTVRLNCLMSNSLTLTLFLIFFSSSLFWILPFQFIILASALCCTAFAYPVFEDYQYAGHDLSSHEGDSFDNGSYQPVAASRIGVHELGGHEDEHVDYYVCKKRWFQFIIHFYLS